MNDVLKITPQDIDEAKLTSEAKAKETASTMLDTAKTLFVGGKVSLEDIRFVADVAIEAVIKNPEATAAVAEYHKLATKFLDEEGSELSDKGRKGNLVGLNNPAQLANYALKHGLIEFPKDIG